MLASQAPSGLSERVLLGKRIVEGVEPPEQLVPDVLYAARLHALNGEPGQGKTSTALWLAVEVVKRAMPVLYLDAENGPGLIGKRLEGMGVEPELLDEFFHYYVSPEITLDVGVLENLKATAEEVDPALVVFDSLPDFLAVAGLNENDAGDVTRWILEVAQPLKDTGAAVVVLDHLTKSQDGRGRYARGSSAKLAKMDVSWSLGQKQPFGRDTLGEVELRRHKDREAWLPERVRFAVGGSNERFIFRRTNSVLEEKNPVDGLTPGQRKILDHVKSTGEEGATWKALLQKTPKSTLSKVLKELMSLNLVIKEQGRYRTVPREMAPRAEPNGTAKQEPEVEPQCGLPEPNGGGSTRFYGGSAEPDGTDASDEVPPVPPPYRGGTGEPDVELESDLETKLRHLLDEEDV